MPASVVLLHGYTATAAAWDPVLPHLAGREVVAETLPGHHGGPALDGPTVERVADAVAARLEGPAHLVGSSLGAWLALLLAGRGLARSVVALAPAGLWAPGESHARRRFDRMRRMARVSRPLAPLVLRSGAVRRAALRDVCAHGERLSPQEALASIDGLLGCPAHPHLAADIDRRRLAVPALADPGVPVLVAWCERDRIFPPARYLPAGRERLPWAEHRVLPGVGHLPMVDDPALVARTITGWAERAEG